MLPELPLDMPQIAVYCGSDRKGLMIQILNLLSGQYPVNIRIVQGISRRGLVPTHIYCDTQQIFCRCIAASYRPVQHIFHIHVERSPLFVALFTLCKKLPSYIWANSKFTNSWFLIPSAPSDSFSRKLSIQITGPNTWHIAIGTYRFPIPLLGTVQGVLWLMSHSCPPRVHSWLLMAFHEHKGPHGLAVRWTLKNLAQLAGLKRTWTL